MENVTSKNSGFFARVEGRVHGVGFRYTCVIEGQRLGLSGWVRNAAMGDVEVWAEGPEEKLDLLIKWLHRGPPGARVDAVQYSKITPSGKYSNFGVGY